MMIPTITRTTEEMLATVPHAMREAALGPGSSEVANGAVRELAYGDAGHHHRMHAGLCARGRRDCAAAVHGVRQQFWSFKLNAADCGAAAADLRLCALAVR